MSIDVPTAERAGTPQDPRRPPSGGGVWVVAVVALALVTALVVVADDGAITPSPPTATPDDPYDPFDAIARAFEPREQWSLTSFPGGGSFTGVAVGAAGVLAAGFDTDEGGRAFAWHHDPRTTTWTTVDLEASERASINSVVAIDDDFWVGGSISGIGLPTEPAVWRGDAAGLVLEERPFGSPGQVDAVRSLDSTLVVLGRSGVVGPGNLRPGSARYGRLVVRVDDQWVDRTPGGLSVVVTEVVASDDGRWIAVGGDASDAVVWTTDDRGETWSEPQVVAPRALVSDVAIATDGTRWLAVRTWDDRLEPRVQIFRADGGGWTADGEILRRDVGWIVPVEGGLAGGPLERESLDVWYHRTTEGWARTTLPAARGEDGAVRAEAWPLVVGEANDQPAAWLDRPIVWEPVDEVADAAWERVGVPAAGEPARELAGILISPRSAGIALSDNGLRWIERQLPGRLTGAARSDDGVLAWGVSTEGAYVEEISMQGVLSSGSVEDAQIMVAWDAGDGIVALARTQDGSVRLAMGFPDGPPTPVADLPARVVRVGDVLLGFGVARPADVAVSVDDGSSWTDLDVPVYAAGLLDGELAVITPDGRLLSLAADPIRLEPMPFEAGKPLVTPESALAAIPTSWGDGIIVGNAAVLRRGPNGVARVEDLPTGVDAGVIGAFGRLVPGPGRWAIVEELGVPVLYRWAGLPAETGD